MANLVEVESYDDGVYRIETSDQVLGGETGTTNKPLKNLANRTNWLKVRWTEMSAALSVINGVLADLKSAATKVANAVKTNGDVPLWDSVYSAAQIDSMLANAGNRLAHGTATIADYAASRTVNVSLGTTLDDANYYVVGSAVSMSSPSSDVIAGNWVISGRTTTQFTVTFGEWSGEVTSLQFDWEIKKK